MHMMQFKKLRTEHKPVNNNSYLSDFLV